MLKTYSSLDIAKFILSIFIVILHVNPFGTQYSYVVYPIVRIAVPLFFMISAFLLFSKVNACDSTAQQLRSLVLFAKRNLTLYAVWFVILLPITLLHRRYFADGLLRGFVNLFVSFFLGSTFSASWFIMALVIGAFIIYFSDKYLKRVLTLIIAGFLYVMCCLVSNYGGMFTQLTDFVITIYPRDIFNSFPVSLLWVYLGKMFADSFSYRKPFSYKKIVLLIISLVLLYAEYLIIRHLDCVRYNDCYFMLVPLCIVTFSLLLDWNVDIRCGRMLRTFSTVTYCMHASLRFVVAFVFEILGYDINVMPYSTMVFLVVIATCMVASYLVYSLQKYKFFRWIKYLA